jgi:hypothetical protein
MADESQTPNRITATGRTRSVAQGDVPDAFRRRYYTDERGGAGLGFYVDATVQRPAFRDEGRRLVAGRADPTAIRDMAAIAEHRGWTIVTARGSAEFRREAWLAGRTLGIEVRGYRPSERDMQELERRRTRRIRVEDAREKQNDQAQTRRNHAADEREVRRGRHDDRRADAAAGSQLRIVDAVVRARVNDSDRRDQILRAARERVASWLERGAQFEVLPSRERAVDAEGRRERQRGR